LPDMLLADDLFQKHSARGAPTLLLECALPIAASTRAFAGGSTSLSLYAKTFRSPSFKSNAYSIVFRHGMGALFTGLALQGVNLAIRSRHAIRNLVLLSNIGCCLVLGVGLFFAGGLYSRPTLSGRVRDSLIVCGNVNVASD
jgi:hypothetical protein